MNANNTLYMVHLLSGYQDPLNPKIEYYCETTVSDLHRGWYTRLLDGGGFYKTGLYIVLVSEQTNKKRLDKNYEYHKGIINYIKLKKGLKKYISKL